MTLCTSGAAKGQDAYLALMLTEQISCQRRGAQCKPALTFDKETPTPDQRGDKQQSQDQHAQANQRVGQAHLDSSPVETALVAHTRCDAQAAQVVVDKAAHAQIEARKHKD